MLSYGVVFMAMVTSNPNSYSVISKLNHRHEQQQQQQQQETQQASVENKQDKPQAQQGSGTFSLRTQQQRPLHDLQPIMRGAATASNTTTTTSANRRNKNKNKQGDEIKEDEIDAFIFGLWVVFSVLSYAKIRVEPGRSYYRSGFAPSSRLTRAEQQEINLRTLRRINEERQLLGQEPISLESYEMFQQVVSDRSIWRALAQTRQQQNAPPRGATLEQLESCPQKTIEEDDEEQQNEPGECSICLATYKAKDIVRTLPCQHSFHTECVDRWLEQSILCPICKQSL